MKLLKILRYVVLIGLVAFALSRLIPHLGDFSEVWNLKDQIRYRWIFAAIVSQLFQYIGDGWFSQILLQIVNVKVSIKDSFRIASLNVFAAHLLPIGEAGGVAAAYHFYRRLGVDSEKFIFLTVCWTAVTHIILLLLFIMPIFFLQELPIAINTSFTVINLMITGGIVLSLYLTRKKLFHKLEKWIGKHEWAKPFFSFIRKRKTYFKLITDQPGLFSLTMLASLIYYASNIATLAFSFMAFGIMPPMALIVFAYAASLIFSKITLSPAGLGAAEASLILIFLEGGMDPHLTVGAVIVYRLISFWLPIPAGFASFYSLRKKKTVN